VTAAAFLAQRGVLRNNETQNQRQNPNGKRHGQTKGKRRGGAADLRWVEGGQRGRERSVSSRDTLVYVKNIAQKGAELDLKKGGGRHI
jgi:hypothetical protein